MYDTRAYDSYKIPLKIIQRYGSIVSCEQSIQEQIYQELASVQHPRHYFLPLKPVGQELTRKFHDTVCEPVRCKSSASVCTGHTTQ